LMRRLLTGYAIRFNRRHRRHGQLFQNRYKSIICQEDLYLKELVRYIHLNPLRAKLVSHMTGLNRYLYSKGRHKVRAEARSVFCYWSVRELGVEGTQIAKKLQMSQPGVAYAVRRGEKIVKAKAIQIIE